MSPLPALFYIDIFLPLARKGSEPKSTQVFTLERDTVYSEGMTLYFETNGEIRKIEEKEEIYFYSYDVCDGRREKGLQRPIMKSVFLLPAGEMREVKIVYSMENALQDADLIIEGMRKYRRSLEEQAAFVMPMARELSKSANQFVSKRESTGGSTILAGYPFFEDWGRDTMIALPGVCIVTGQYENGKKNFCVHLLCMSEKD